MLEEQLSLAHYSIVPSFALQLEPKEPGLIDLEVRMTQGQITVQANKWETVAAVKTMCKWTDEVLMLEGHSLDEGRILVSYNLRSDSILQLLSPQLQVFIKPLDGQTFPLTLCLSDTIAQVKEKIEAQERIPKAAQNLVLGREVLKDAKTLAEYNIVRNMTIRLVVMKHTECTVS